MDPLIGTLGAVAGAGMSTVGMFGALKMRSNLWKSPFAMFFVAGLLLTLGSTTHLLYLLGAIPSIFISLELAMTVSFILLILGTSLILLVLARIYGDSTFSAVLLPRDAFCKMAQRLERMYGRTGAKHIMYALGKDSEYDRAQEIKRKLKVDNESYVKWLPDIFDLLGWAEKTEIVEYVPKETLLLRTLNNFVAHSTPEDGVVSCNFISGSIAGLSKAVHPGMDCEVVEVKCQNRGDDYCEFAVNFFPIPPW
ncbi:MAG: hypothetical protein ACE5QF_08515 [Thermoplasmata archaeon]